MNTTPTEPSSRVPAAPEAAATPKATAPACCAPSEQATCCEPSAKSSCCGSPEPTAAAPSRCGCR